jgi:colanic acid biosynthesis glycosyl transferase WcaI
MRILICSANFAPEQIGIGKYSGEMAAWLVKQGHQVRVVAAPPYYPAWKVDAAYAGQSYLREQWCGVDVFRSPLWVPASPTGITRALSLLSFAITSLPVMFGHILWRPEVTIAIVPSLLSAPAAWLTARLCGGEAWLHLQDLEADCAFEMGLLKAQWLRRLVLAFECRLLRRFDCVSTISRRMLERLAGKGVAAERLRLFPNWVDIGHVKPLAAESSYRAELGIAADSVVVLYAGTFGRKQGLMLIPEAATRLADRTDVVFVLCGEGVMREALESAADRLRNVRMIPLQPFERIGELLGIADIHLLPQSPRASDLVLPSKLSGMLASGRPVIATCNPGTELDAVVSECGVVVPPEDSQAVTEAIIKLADNPTLRRELGRKGRAYAESQFDRDEVLRQVFGSLSMRSRSHGAVHRARGARRMLDILFASVIAALLAPIALSVGLLIKLTRRPLAPARPHPHDGGLKSPRSSRTGSPPGAVAPEESDITT